MSSQEKRDGFRGKWGFILACIGSAVGMANIWRFPYLVARYGGLTFLLPYLLFVLVIAASGVIGGVCPGPLGGGGTGGGLREGHPGTAG